MGVVAVFKNDAQTLMHGHPASYLTFSLTKAYFWTVYHSCPSTLTLWKTKAKAIKGNGWTGWLARGWRRRPFISNCSDVSFWSDCLYHYRRGLCSACMTRLAEKKSGERQTKKKKKRYRLLRLWEPVTLTLYILHFKYPLTPNKWRSKFVGSVSQPCLQLAHD